MQYSTVLRNISLLILVLSATGVGTSVSSAKSLQQIQSQIEECLSAPPEASEVGINVNIFFDESGMPTKTNHDGSFLISSSGTNPKTVKIGRLFYNAVQRAIIRCAPYEIPSENYSDQQAIILFSFTSARLGNVTAELPEWDGVYIQTLDGKYHALDVIKNNWIPVQNEIRVHSQNSTNDNLPEISVQQFKAIVIKGHRGHSAFSLHPIIGDELSDGGKIIYRFLQNSEIRLRRKSIDNNTHYIEPASKLSEGTTYAGWIGPEYWVFRITH